MVKVRCPKCGTIFPPEARDVQICPNCGCVLKIPRRSAIKRYATNRREDQYDTPQQAQLPDRSSGVYLSREEYENLLYKAKARKDQPGENEELYRDNYTDDYAGGAPSEYDTPRDLYEYRREPEAEKPRDNAEQQYTAQDSGAEAHLAGAEKEQQPQYTSYVPTQLPVPAQPQKQTGVFSMVLSVVLSAAAGVMSVLLLVFGVIGNGLFVTTQGVHMVSNGSIPQKLVILLITILPALFALFGLVGSLTRKKALAIIMGVLLIFAFIATMVINPLYEIAGSMEFSIEGAALPDSFFEQNVWVYITAGLELIAAISLFARSAKIKKNH